VHELNQCFFFCWQFDSLITGYTSLHILAQLLFVEQFITGHFMALFVLVFTSPASTGSSLNHRQGRNRNLCKWRCCYDDFWRAGLVG